MSADTLKEFRVIRKKVIKEETYIYAESWSLRLMMQLLMTLLNGSI
jgi:hypothetical protein